MRLSRFAKTLIAIAIALISIAAFTLRNYWHSQNTRSSSNPPTSASVQPAEPTDKIIISEQAQKNLGVVAKSMQAETFWKTITVPGMIVDRPGFSDREIVAPAVGSVSRILRVPGDTVRPGDTLFTLKLLSDSVHQAQSELYKATEEIKLNEARRQRLTAAGGAIAQSRVIEVESEIKRLEVACEACRYELRNHGLSNDDIVGVAYGKFVSEIPIVVPAPKEKDNSLAHALIENNQAPADNESPPSFEVQELKVDVGEQVQAGESLCLLSNHQSLVIEGRAFRDETPLLERCLKEGWPVEVDFQEDDAADWPPIDESYSIRHIANTIDPTTRTFAFLLPLQNQAKAVERDGKTQLLWRFRPGQKVRLRVPVEKLDNVFVLPADAVVREGPEAYVFTQNVNTFERKGVHLVFRDRDRVVVANDGTFPTYVKNGVSTTVAAVARSSAAQLNRMTKAGSTAVPKGYHIHADGSLHKNEDEGK